MVSDEIDVNLPWSALVRDDLGSGLRRWHIRPLTWAVAPTPFFWSIERIERMAFCYFLAAFALSLGGVAVFFLTDGDVRRAAHLVLARRLGGVFRPRLIVVGDSLAAGCPWSNLHRSPFAVLNLAEGGATLKQVAGQVYRVRGLPGARLLMNGGLNDLLFDRASIEQFGTDCQALFRRIDSHERVLFTLMPFTANPADAGRIETANAIVSRLCADCNIVVLDINTAVSSNRIRKPEMTDDGLHFTRAAEQIWIQTVREALD